MSGNVKRNTENFGCGTASPYLLMALMTGVVLVFIGVLLFISGSMFGGDGSASSFGIVFVGPFPIIFGEGTNTDLVVTAGLIIGVLSLLAFIFMCRKVRQAKV